LYSFLFLGLSSFSLCLILTPVIRTWFRRLGAFDRPNEGSGLHSSPIPRVGGIAIAISYLAALGFLVLSPLRGAASVNLPFVWHLLPAAAVVFTTGLLDDLIGLSPWQKLTGQIAAAGLAYWAGVRIFGVAGYSAHGWWTFPLTILWLVACSNAFNLIDGVDGLATGVGLFATLTIFLAALLGCYGAIWSQKSATLLGMTAPLMALSIPLLDTALSIVRRFLRHQPIFEGDRNHIHHRLLARGFSPRRVVLVLYGVCGLAAALSLLQSLLHNRFGGLIIVIFCAATWVGIQNLGYGEFDTARRLVLKGTFRHILQTQLYMITFEKKLVASTSSAECWCVIREAGRHYGYAQVRMHLGGIVYEDFLDRTFHGKSWTIRIPLSERDYVNFTHYSESSVRQLIAMTSLVEILPRALRSRTLVFQTSETSSAGNDQLMMFHNL
jgi:UDP-GlcNAc:undecaprenyl-phosphate GlcNAc-1-phosphate transferase